jgi:hypothetical protein
MAKNDRQAAKRVQKKQAKKARMVKAKSTESVFAKSPKTIGDPAGSEPQRTRWRKTQKVKQRNAARKEWRKAHPEKSGQPSGRQLNQWPLPA